MLVYFSDPYADELLYSVLARYHYYSGNTSVKRTLVDLFGNTNVIPSVYVPSRLGYLASMLRSPKYTPEYFIQGNTVLPYYLPFIKAPKLDAIITATIGDGGQTLFTRIGMAAGGVCRKNGLYYCPVCVDADIQQMGEPFYHRMHHLEGILTCWIHGCYLKEYKPYQERSSRILLYKLTEKNIDMSTQYPDSTQVEIHKNLAAVAHTIVTIQYNSVSFCKVQDAILVLLKRAGYLTRKGCVRQKDICHDFHEYFGETNLKTLQSDFDVDSDFTWVRGITRNGQRQVHPIRYTFSLVFMCYTGEASKLV